MNNQDIKNKGKKTWDEFKAFLNQGNIVDMAVGVIIGSAFGKIVSSLVNDILMPVIGVLIGGIDFSALSINIGNAKILYGTFIQNIIDFLIIAFCVFCFVKMISAITSQAKKKEEEEKQVEKSVEDKQLEVLDEIKNLLQNIKK